MEKKEPIRIYVACLASYNNGILHGVWIDATLGEDHMWSETKVMLAASPIDGAEEYEVHDVEGFDGAYMSGNHDFACIADLAEIIQEHGKLGSQLLVHFGDIEDAREALEDHYHGIYESVADFAQELTEETTSIPDNLAFYIDYEKMGHDLEVGDIFTVQTAYNEVHIFWNF